MNNGNKKIDTKKDDSTIEVALLMAAGMGTRIRPLSEDTPKPLIKVNGITMIESLIKSIQQAGIEDIIISVGYKKEKYYFLAEKYEGITFVENDEYKSKNTISSFHAAMDLLDGKNCIVSESDLFVKDPSIVRSTMDISRYYIHEAEKQDYEWGFLLKDNQHIREVVRPMKGRYLGHRMYGLAYWLKDDLKQIIEAVENRYKTSGHEDLAYDEVVNELYKKLDVGVIKLENDQLYEIDNLDDLTRVDPSYATYKQEED